MSLEQVAADSKITHNCAWFDEIKKLENYVQIWHDIGQQTKIPTIDMFFIEIT